MSDRNIIVVEASETPIDKRPVEIVERKGIGHPDTICDGIAERVSVEYMKWCHENLGAPLHHNFDKVQLVAGETDVSYGHAQMLKPIRIQLAGRGTPVAPDGTKVPMDAIAIKAAKDHISETLKYLDPNVHVVVDSYAGRGSSELIFAVDEITANDTSFGVAHWPRSGLEHAVYETCEYITGTLIDTYPLGEDVKVMGYRSGNDVTLTCAVPFMAEKIKSREEYVEVRTAVEKAIQNYADGLDDRNMVVNVNTADNVEADAVYLTLTGTSAEMGDDGSVGRGNRVTGVIAPFRSASLEAAAGKNPISHVGKLYNILALEAAKEIHAVCDEVAAVQVYILSQIGQPLDKPLVATANVDVKDGKPLTDAGRAKVVEILDRHLADMTGLRKKLINQEVTLY